MMNDLQVIGFARRLSPKIWYSGQQLQDLWGVTKSERRLLIPRMKKRKILRTKGNTTQLRYQRLPESVWTSQGKPLIPVDRTVEKTGNGIIDAKLRKEANLPETPTALENLIAAATNVGTENEVLKQALLEIDAIIAKVREYL